MKLNIKFDASATFLRSAFLCLSLIFALLFISCSNKTKPPTQSYQNISSKELYHTYQTIPWKIIDIRTKEEFQSGHLPGAILFPWADFSEENFQKYQLQKDDYLLIYCNSGVRSLPPSEMLARHGYRKVHNLLDGIRGWSYEIEH